MESFNEDVLVLMFQISLEYGLLISFISGLIIWLILRFKSLTPRLLFAFLYMISWLPYFITTVYLPEIDSEHSGWLANFRAQFIIVFLISATWHFFFLRFLDNAYFKFNEWIERRKKTSRKESRK